MLMFPKKPSPVCPLQSVMLLMAVRSLFGVRSRSGRNETKIGRKARREGDTVMAAEGLVEEFCDEITCPICLSSFQDPVILVECGHNFCRACLTGCWDEAEGCCPYCRRRVSTESFRANRQLGNLAGLVKRLQERREADVERGVCLRHQEPLKLYCKDDGAPICVVCDRSKEHRTHEVVPAEEAAETYKEVVKIHQKSLEKERKKLVDEKLAEEQKCQMYLARFKSLAGMVKITFEQQRTFLEEKEHLLLTQLRDLLIEFKKRKEENILRLSEDISHLGGQITEMEEKCQQPLSKFLQDIRSTLSRYEGKRQVRQLVEDSPELEEKIRDCVQTNVVVMKAMKKCKESLNEALNKVKVTLDPKTANPRLILSENQKKARWEIVRQNLPDNPERFDVMPCVLGCEGFCSGRRWWEVRVDPEVEVEERGWIMWAVGITRKSSLRKGRISPSPNEGIWAIGKTSYPFTSCQLSAFASPEPTPLTLRQELRKIRVSLDYEDGRVEFFDADTDHLIFTFPSASFDGEKVYPYFWMGWGVQLTC
ncbi:zinc finger protein RFP isoform X1 [Pogona vitticeps]